MTADTDDDALAAQKAGARKAAGRTRAAAHAELAEKAARALAVTGLNFLSPSTEGVVSGFYPYRTEIDLRPMLTTIGRQGWTTCLPIVLGAGIPLDFKAWRPGDDTVPGAWGIPIPPPAAQDVEPDVMLVPLLAFDRAGYRLGYGGGFYDRTIEKLRGQKPLITIGIAFAAQEVAQVIRGPYDQPLDWILTETGPIEIAAENAYRL
ncbi:MAG: 5-formyltetrahydrofolate cyclo-ligase [Pseudomonadota bacterium]